MDSYNVNFRLMVFGINNKGVFKFDSVRTLAFCRVCADVIGFYHPRYHHNKSFEEQRQVLVSFFQKVVSVLRVYSGFHKACEGYERSECGFADVENFLVMNKEEIMKTASTRFYIAKMCLRLLENK